MYQIEKDGDNIQWWYGKQDGILRKQVIHIPDDNTEITSVIDDVVINPKTTDDMFRFTSREKVKREDKTEELFKNIETLKNLYPANGRKEKGSRKEMEKK